MKLGRAANPDGLLHRTRLLFSFGGLIFILALFMAFYLAFLVISSHRIQTAVSGNFTAHRLLQESARIVYEIKDEVVDATLAAPGDRREAPTLDTLSQRTKSLFGELSALLPGQAAEIGSLRSSFEIFLASSATVSSRGSEDGVNSAAEFSGFRDKQHALSEQINLRLAAVDNQFEGSLRSLGNDFRLASLVLAAAASIAAILYAMLAIFLARRLTRPLRSLAAVAETVARGNYAARAEIEFSGEAAVLAAAMNRMLEEIQRNGRELEERVRVRTEELAASNESLEAAIQALSSAQDKMVASEKMAALGQLVAGIAHELNTPLGAIESSVQTAMDEFSVALAEAPRAFRAAGTTELRFLRDCLAAGDNAVERFSPEAARQVKKEFSLALEEAGIVDAESMAESLVDMGFETYPSYVGSLLSTPAGRDFFDLSARLSSATRSCRIAISAAGMASRVIGALRIYAHSNSDPSVTSVDVRAQIESLLALYYGRIRHRVNVALSGPEEVFARGNADELGQVWVNLMNNALHAMEYRGALGIGIDRGGGKVIVSFSDTGPGIPEEMRSHLFEPFFTTKAKGEGTGLGLYIVKNIIERNGGSVGFESEPGKTVFTVILPETDG